MSDLISRAEIRRLERAAREKDKRHLIAWADAFERTICKEIHDQYEKVYQVELGNSIDTFILVIIYTLLRDSNINIKSPDKMPFFLDSLLRNVDRFRTGEAKKEDYEKDLRRTGINLKEYNYTQRVTDFVAVIASKGKSKQKNRLLKDLKKQEVVILELDPYIKKGNKKQIFKNLDMINACTRFYVIGTSDDIETYVQAAHLAGKPVIDVTWKDDIEYEGENENENI